MIPSLPIMKVVDEWCNALSTNSDLIDFCAETFGKQPKVFVGLPVNAPPTANDCPYVIIFPGTKDEGEDNDENTYAFTVGLAVKARELPAIEGNVVRVQGLSELDQLAQLVLQTLDEWDPDCSISNVQGSMEPRAHWPQLVYEFNIQLTKVWDHNQALSYGRDS